MNYEHEDLIDLGAVSVETKGDLGVPEDTNGRDIPFAGLNAE